jgi:hypothetical protein
MIAKFTEDEFADFFAFLDDLRESGVTNMSGAGEHLALNYDLNARDACAVLVAWMRSFRHDRSPVQRAADWLRAIEWIAG